MKKKSFKISTLACVALLTSTTLLPLNGFEAGDCSDGIPRRSCKIWDVEYNETEPGSSGEVSCSTGGSWQCYVGPDN